MKKYFMFTMMNTKYLKQLHANQKEILVECWKSRMEGHCIRPQIWDHSNKVPISKDFKWSRGLTISSNVQVLCSCQIKHVRQVSAKFQIFEECFPNQFLHANRKDATVSSITPWIPNIRKTSLHNTWAKWQWSKRWSTVFPSQQHSYLWFFVFSLNQSCPIFILPAGLKFETPTQNLAT